MKVSAATPEALRAIEARTGCVLTANARGIQATDSRGKVRGVVAYDAWTENAVQAHMWTDSAIVWRSLLPAVFAYPFLEAGKGLLLGIIPADNLKSSEMAHRLGFRLAHRVRDGWAVGVDLLCFEMRRDECRHLKGLHHG